jgi:hypothetical protein
VTDFVGKFAMLVWITAQSAHPELAARMQGTYHGTALMSGCADRGD